MTIRKQRLTVTVDAALIRAGDAAVASGRAPSLSAWVNTALAERAEKERRLAAMGAAIAAYEAAHGEITLAEVAEQRRADRRAAVAVSPARHAAAGGRQRRRLA